MQSILEIVVESLSPEERRGLALGEEIYRMFGCPVRDAEIRRCVDVYISECIKRNLRYGRAVLRQLKRWERGEWRPSIPISPQTDFAGARPKAAALEREELRRLKENAS